MRQLFLINSLSVPAAAYGIGTYIDQLTSCLAGTDIACTVIHIGSQQLEITVEEEEGVTYIYIPGQQPSVPPRHYHRNLVYFLKSYLEINPGPLPIFHLNYMIHGEIAVQLKKHFDCKLLLTVHYMRWTFELFKDMPRLQYFLDTPIEEMADPNEKRIKTDLINDQNIVDTCDHIVAIAEHSAKTIQRIYHLDPSKVTVVQNGLRDAYVPVSAENKQALRKKYYFSEHEKIVMYAGRFDKQKGLKYLIQAMRFVLEKNTDTRLVVAGHGSFTEYMQDSNPYWSKITFTGFIPKEDLYPLFQAADIGVLPSLYEEFGYVAIEMMMNGLPLVVNQSTGLAESVQDSICGLHVKLEPENEDTPEKLANKALELLEDPDTRARMAAASRERYLSRYKIEEFGRKMLAVYHGL